MVGRWLNCCNGKRLSWVKEWHYQLTAEVIGREDGFEWHVFDRYVETLSKGTAKTKFAAMKKASSELVRLELHNLLPKTKS